MDVRRDLLCLHFHKNLQYKNTTILILFTYFIAILIPFLIKQLSPNNFIDMALVAIFSFAFIGPIVLFLNEFNYHLENILKELKILQNEKNIQKNKLST